MMSPVCMTREVESESQRATPIPSTSDLGGVRASWEPGSVQFADELVAAPAKAAWQ